MYGTTRDLKNDHIFLILQALLDCCDRTVQQYSNESGPNIYVLASILFGLYTMVKQVKMGVVALFPILNMFLCKKNISMTVKVLGEVAFPVHLDQI